MDKLIFPEKNSSKKDFPEKVCGNFFFFERLCEIKSPPPSAKIVHEHSLENEQLFLLDILI